MGFKLVTNANNMYYNLSKHQIIVIPHLLNDCRYY